MPVSFFTELTQATVAIARLPKKTKPPVTCQFTEGVMFFMKKSLLQTGMPKIANKFYMQQKNK